MIILEGPDGAGKTTLLNELREELDLPVSKRVVSKDAEAMFDLRQWVDENLSQGWMPVLFDRHRLISEFIYGPILRGRPEDGFDDRKWLGDALRRFNDIRPTVIYCLPPLSVVWENVMTDDDNKIFHHNPRALEQVYWSYFNKALGEKAARQDRIWIYDYTESDAKLKCRRIINRLILMVETRRRMENF